MDFAVVDFEATGYWYDNDSCLCIVRVGKGFIWIQVVWMVYIWGCGWQISAVKYNGYQTYDFDTKKYPDFGWHDYRNLNF